jgi:hypothetical protein
VCCRPPKRHGASVTLTSQRISALLERIGVNLGDVIVEGEDRHGDGVNVATRLQQVAEAGGICVSRTVAGNRESTSSRCGLSRLASIASRTLPSPVSMYRVVLDGTAARPQAAQVAGTQVWAMVPMLRRPRSYWRSLPARSLGTAIGANPHAHWHRRSHRSRCFLSTMSARIRSGRASPMGSARMSLGICRVWVTSLSSQETPPGFTRVVVSTSRGRL